MISAFYNFETSTSVAQICVYLKKKQPNKIMSDRNVNRANKRKRVVEDKVDKVDLCSVEPSPSSLNYPKTVKKSKSSASVSEINDNEQSDEKFDFLNEALKKLHELESEIAAIEEGTEDEDHV